MTRLGYAEKRGSGAGAYWRARYKIEPGRYGTLEQKFSGKREAKQAADAEEARIASLEHKPLPRDMTFGAFASSWYAGLDLAASTMVNYRRHLEEHILPAFEKPRWRRCWRRTLTPGTRGSAVQGTRRPR